MQSVALAVKKLSFRYEGEEVLKEVDLELEKNEFLAIIGPNGGGKTTLLKLLCGFLKPSSGSVEVLGFSPKKAYSKIGYVPQNININTDFPITVFDVVMMGADKGDTASAKAALENVGMTAFSWKKIGSLSGGQQQRVMIARAIASKETEILFLDEPTSHIDADAQKDIYVLLRELSQKMTVVIVSHDLAVTAGYATKVAYVNHTLVMHNAPNAVSEEMIDADGHVCEVELLNHFWKKDA